jgi:hypothetical protein
MPYESYEKIYRLPMAHGWMKNSNYIWCLQWRQKYTFIVEPKDESIYNEHTQLLEIDAMPVLGSDNDSETAAPTNELCLFQARYLLSIA